MPETHKDFPDTVHTVATTSTWTSIEVTVIHSHGFIRCFVVYASNLDKQSGEDCQSFPALLHWRLIKESMVR